MKPRAWLVLMPVLAGCSGKAMPPPPQADVDGDVADVASDFSAPCWRTTSGAVHCYDASTPLAGLESDVVEITAGWFHDCARKRDGRVFCWGSNTGGELGPLVPVTKDVLARFPPSEVRAQGAPFTAIAAGHGASCALDADGAAWCWGAGDGTPRRLAIAGKVSALAVGRSHVCVIGARGVAGANVVSCKVVADAGAPFEDATASDPVQVVAGDSFACSRSSVGAVSCWAPTPPAGASSDPVWFSAPVKYGPPETPAFVELVAGEHHVCARDADGGLWCWGDNLSNQCGQAHPTFQDGTDGIIRSPERVSALPPVARAAPGRGLYSCAATSRGALFCWGLFFQETCNGDPACNATPRRVSP